MGQCAPSSTLNYSQNSIDEDEVSFITNPAGDIVCHGGLPLQKAFFQNSDEQHMRKSVLYEKFANKTDDHQQSDFLRVHHQDIPQRCIVDQSEIKRAVWLQSDEILHRQGQLKMHGVSEDYLQIRDESPIDGVGVSAIENDGDNEQKSMRSVPSTTSAITCTSKTTIVTTNTKEVAENEQKIRSARIASSRINPSNYTTSSLSPSLSNNDIKEKMSNFSSHNSLKRPGSYQMRPIKEQSVFTSAKLTTRRKSLYDDKTDVSDQRPILPHSIKKDSERFQCMSILRLKVKAKVGWFYTQRYLTVFPSELKAIVGVDPKNDIGIPELTCESLDGSLSSSGSSDSDHANITEYGPVPPTTLVKCPVTNESMFDLAITGCLGLVPRDQGHNALRSSRRQLRHHYEKTPDHCIVLVNRRSGSPLAVCAMKETSSSPIVRIYYTRQIAFAQKPTTTTQQLGLDWADDLPLYAYAEVNYKGDFPDEMNFSVFIANRFDGSISSQPSYMAYLDGQAINDNATIRSPVMKMVGRTDSERNMSGCALIWIQSDKATKSRSPGNLSDLSFHINLARGIDPAFSICFTAIVDEILENSMRTRYKNNIIGRKRKDSFSLTKSRLEARSRVAIENHASDLPCKMNFCKYTKCNF